MGGRSMMPLIGNPFVLEAGSTEIEEQAELMVTDVQVIDELRLTNTIQSLNGFDFYAYLTETQEIVVEVMRQLHSVVGQGDMMLSDVRNALFLQQDFKSILIDLFLEPTS